MKRYLIPALLITSTAIAGSTDTYTSEVPQHGCYKNNESDQCVETTLIKCTYNLDRDVALYGPVVASMCDDMRYYKKAIRDLKKRR
jgi:hypothetical protein